MDGLREQLLAEAQRQVLAQAAKVLVVADGAIWIWNLSSDRFPQAHQRGLLPRQPAPVGGGARAAPEDQAAA
jgi:hypothetical protein